MLSACGTPAHPSQETIHRSEEYVLYSVIQSMSETDTADGSPPFDDTFDSDDAEQRIYGTIL